MTDPQCLEKKALVELAKKWSELGLVWASEPDMSPAIKPAVGLFLSLDPAEIAPFRCCSPHDRAVQTFGGCFYKWDHLLRDKIEMNRTHFNMLPVTPIMYRVKVGLELTQWFNTKSCSVCFVFVFCTSFALYVFVVCFLHVIRIVCLFFAHVRTLGLIRAVWALHMLCMVPEVHA